MREQQCPECGKITNDIDARMFDSDSAVGMRRSCLACFIEYVTKTGFEPIGDADAHAAWCGMPSHTAGDMTAALKKVGTGNEHSDNRNWLSKIIKWLLKS